VPAPQLSSCPYLKTLCDFNELYFFFFPDDYFLSLENQCSHRWVFARLFITFSITWDQWQPSARRRSQSLLWVGEGSGSALALAGVALYVRGSGFAAPSSPLALTPRALCREEGEERRPGTPEWLQALVQNPSLALCCWQQRFICSSGAGAATLSDSPLRTLTHQERSLSAWQGSSACLRCVLGAFALTGATPEAAVSPTAEKCCENTKLQGEVCGSSVVLDGGKRPPKAPYPLLRPAPPACLPGEGRGAPGRESAPWSLRSKAPRVVKGIQR